MVPTATHRGWGKKELEFNHLEEFPVYRATLIELNPPIPEKIQLWFFSSAFEQWVGLDTTFLSIQFASLHSLEPEGWIACQEFLRSHAKEKKKPLYILTWAVFNQDAHTGS